MAALRLGRNTNYYVTYDDFLSFLTNFILKCLFKHCKITDSLVSGS